ncbi:hypothetical protein C5167_024474 [Papaver somniferum]|uniref:Uncharacterized protein n=1 Tax=Papaver somniferum TaxID=3469 RepID=A0A4Y7JNQ3_PAPSO|nr:hypothetical protein C5167_024474 [Papaver somniferum]
MTIIALLVSMVMKRITQRFPPSAIITITFPASSNGWRGAPHALYAASIILSGNDHSVVEHLHGYKFRSGSKQY